MESEQLHTLRRELVRLAKPVAHFIREEITQVSKSDVLAKERNSLVSYVDREAEKMLVKHLSDLVPEAGFITEENTVSSESKNLMWVIDPLDGTTNFLYNLPHFSISVALLENSQPLLGLVYEIMQDRAFTAVKNGGAYEDEKSITVSGRTEASEAMIVTGFPYKRELKLDERIEVLKYAILNYRGIRRLGSAALDLAYVASGRFDIYYENSLNIWDIAAGALLVEEAGGKIRDYSGTNNFLKSGSVIAATPYLYDDIAKIISTHLN